MEKKSIFKTGTKIILMTFIMIVLLFTVTVETKAEDTYIEPKNDFRSAWITPINGDLTTYTTETAYKTQMNEIFAIMEHYNLNAMIFHVRTHNNALYKSTLNPIHKIWSSVNFNTFDPLKWVIEECHKRGIEFHAWMNPYRIDSGQYGSSLPSSNPASNPANVLEFSNKRILNPGLPQVRQFLFDTVMEVVENYDVDAIHFDDYFYINLGANGATSGDNTILNEPDQATFATYPGNYNVNSATSKADWRREQINLFIEGLHHKITQYNGENGKHIQFGIAPTGIYRNGNGTVTYDAQGKPITNGSQTAGQEHYKSYLFCDSLKWCVEGWIDYIIPQSYWATDHSVAGYEKVMGWWNKVVKNLDVNLYSGIGVYFADESTNTWGWQTNEFELANQLKFLTTLENVKGSSIYSFKFLKMAYRGGTTMASRQLSHLKSRWIHKVLLPEITSMNPVQVGKVNQLKLTNKTLSWAHHPNAKFYAIYRSTNNLTFTQTEMVDIVGANPNTSTVSWTDHMTGEYFYAIRAISSTNHLGELTTINPSIPTFIIETDTGATQGTEVTINQGAINGTEIKVGFTRFVYIGEGASDKSRLSYQWTSSDESVATISVYGTITAKSPGTTVIRGVNKADNNIWGEITITVYSHKYSVQVNTNGIGGFVNADINTTTGKFVEGKYADFATVTASNDQGEFLFWVMNGKIVSIDSNYQFTVTENHVLTAYFSSKDQYAVAFIDSNLTIIDFILVSKNQSTTTEKLPSEKPGYVFNGWPNISNVIENKMIQATYTKEEESLSVKVVGGVIKNVNTSETITNRGNMVTVISTDDNFKFWKREDQIVSFNREYSFSVYQDIIVSAESNDTVNENNQIFITLLNDDNINKKVGFGGQFYLPNEEELIEIGLEYRYDDIGSNNMDSSNKKRILRYSFNNEFSIIFDTSVNTKISLRYYMITRNDSQLKTTYSNWKVWSGVIETEATEVEELYYDELKKEVSDWYDLDIITSENMVITVTDPNGISAPHTTYKNVNGKLVLGLLVTPETLAGDYIFHISSNNLDYVFTLYQATNTFYKIRFDAFDNLIISKEELEYDYSLIGEQFLSDWNRITNSTLSNFHHLTFFNRAKTDAQTGNLSNSLIYKFFNHPEMKTKWDWLLSYMKSEDNVVWVTRQIDAIRGDGTFVGQPNLYNASHLSYSICNFFTKTHESGGYTAINFTQNAKYDRLQNFNNVIKKNYQNYQLVYEGKEYTIPTGKVKPGETFIKYTNAGTDVMAGEKIILNNSIVLTSIYQ